MCDDGFAGPVPLTAARVPPRCQAPCRTRWWAGTSWRSHPASRNDVAASVKPSGSSQKSRWPRSGKVTSRAPGIRPASSLPLRGSTTLSAPPCRTSVRARMRACLKRPAYSAPAAAWADRARGSAGWEPCSSISPRLAPHHVSPADASGIEHGDDIAGHVGYGKQSGRPVAAPAPPVVHQHKPEVAPQFPPHRFPPGTVETHPLAIRCVTGLR
jgi:hypothetical protein